MSKPILEIDHDTWAESGGTGGIYGRYWHTGRIRFVDAEPPEYEPVVRLVDHDGVVLPDTPVP